MQDHAPLNEMKAFVLGMYVTWVTVPGKELGCTKSNCVSGLWYFGKHSTLHLKIHVKKIGMPNQPRWLVHL